MTKEERNLRYKQTLRDFETFRNGDLHVDPYGLCGYLWYRGFRDAYEHFKGCPEIALFIDKENDNVHPFGGGFREELDPIRKIILDFAIAMTEE